jgi:hypothetical protein
MCFELTRRRGDRDRRAEGQGWTWHRFLCRILSRISLPSGKVYYLHFSPSPICYRNGKEENSFYILAQREKQRLSRKLAGAAHCKRDREVTN